MKNSNKLLFNSIGELLTELDNAPAIPGRDDASEDHSGGPGSSWCDTRSYQEAHDWLMYGHEYEGIETDLSKYKSNGSKTKISTYLDVAGFTPNVPLYLQGVPTCMINKKKSINNKILTFVYQLSVPAGVNQKDIMKTTTQLMKNIIQLEKDGYRCNLYIMNYNDNGHGFGYMIKVKTDRETLNIKKLCFPLVSSSMLRRIDFRVKERLFKDWIGGGYGHGHNSESEIRQFINDTLHLQHYELWDYRGKQYTL